MTEVQPRMFLTLLVLAALLLALAACEGRDPAPVASTTVAPSAREETARAMSIAPQGDYDRIDVSGTGTATGTPDLATLSMGVNVWGGSAQEARLQAAVATERVLAVLRASGVLDEDIATVNVQLYPEYDYDGEYPDEPPEPLGYVATHQLSVKVRNIDNVGGIIDSAVEAGGDAFVFHYLTFGFSDPQAQALEQEALAMAMADMKDKAQRIATAAGRQLGDLKEVAEAGFGYDDLLPEFAYLESMAFASAPTPVEPGQREVVVDVLGVYEMR